MDKTKLLVLAAGKGERLRPLTSGIPKGMVKLKNISLIENIISNAKKNEIFDIDIVTGYKIQKSKTKILIKFIIIYITKLIWFIRSI